MGLCYTPLSPQKRLSWKISECLWEICPEPKGPPPGPELVWSSRTETYNTRRKYLFVKPSGPRVGGRGCRFSVVAWRMGADNTSAGRACNWLFFNLECRCPIIWSASCWVFIIQSVPHLSLSRQPSGALFCTKQPPAAAVIHIHHFEVFIYEAKAPLCQGPSLKRSWHRFIMSGVFDLQGSEMKVYFSF